MAVRRASNRSGNYEFTYRGPIRLFIELMFLFGSAFDTDPQYPWASQILGAPDDQMLRAEQLRDKTLDYQKKVSGSDAANTHKALRDLSVWAKKPVIFSSNQFTPGMQQEMAHIFPQKAAYIGEEGLTVLISEGSAEARQYQFPTIRGDALVVALMFAFGHGCTDDPLYPWISQTLKDERIIDPAARVERLEKETLAWLDRILARPQKGDQT